MIAYHTGKVGRRVVGTNAPPRACVCERWSLSVCGGCVCVCVCDVGSSVADVI